MAKANKKDEVMTTPTVIAFIPGTTASEIMGAAGGTAIWPGILDADLADKTAWATELDTITKLPVGNLVAEYTPSLTCYASLLNYMSTGSNFADGVNFTSYVYNSASKNAIVPAADYLFYMIPYDWRQDDGAGSPSSAQWVADAITQLNNSFGKAGVTEYNLYLVAHSMGGLICRYILEATSPGWSKHVRKLITLGTPHLGAPLALAPILGEKFSSENAAEALFLQTMINNASHPSTYELLPPPAAANFIAEASASPSGMAYSLYDSSDAAFNAALAEWGLKRDVLKDANNNLFSYLKYGDTATPVAYYCMAGTGLETLTSYLYIAGARSASAAFVPQWTASGGDGVVPQASASFETSTAPTVTTFAGYNHGQLAGSDMAKFPACIEHVLGTLIGVPLAATAERSTR
nr:hypothetical protein [uncultured Rhodopila sp.]